MFSCFGIDTIDARRDEWVFDHPRLGGVLRGSGGAYRRHRRCSRSWLPDRWSNAKGAKAKTGTAWSRFLLGNRTVLGPSIYKKYCDSVERDWEIPVKFTGPDGNTLFKVLDVGKYDEKFRWAKNPEQNLAVEGEDYY